MQTDNEQLDQVKTFLKENAIAITVGIVIGVGGLIGWNFYQKHQIKVIQEQATAYSTVMTELNNTAQLISEEGVDNPEKEIAYEKIRNYLKNDDSNYIGIAALSFAKELSKDKSFQEAESVLTEVYPRIKDIYIANNVNYMLAKLQLEQEKFDAAIATLNIVPQAQWGANRFELKADILKQKGDFKEAKTLYEQAINIADPSIQEYLRLKLNNLPS